MMAAASSARLIPQRWRPHSPSGLPAWVPPLLTTNKWKPSSPPKSTRLRSHVLWENPTLETDLSITIFISCKQPHKATHQIFRFLITGEDFCLNSSSSHVVDTEMHHADPSFRKCLPFSCRDASALESSCRCLRGLPGLAGGHTLPRSWAGSMSV